MKSQFTKLYIFFSWAPLILYIMISNYVDHFEGWGAWAAGRMLIYPIIFSVLMGLFGIILIFASLKSKKMSSILVLVTLLSSSVCLWFIGKGIIAEIQRSF